MCSSPDLVRLRSLLLNFEARLRTTRNCDQLTSVIYNLFHLGFWDSVSLSLCICLLIRGVFQLLFPPCVHCEIKLFANFFPFIIFLSLQNDQNNLNCFCGLPVWCCYELEVFILISWQKIIKDVSEGSVQCKLVLFCKNNHREHWLFSWIKCFSEYKLSLTLYWPHLDLSLQQIPLQIPHALSLSRSLALLSVSHLGGQHRPRPLNILFLICYAWSRIIATAASHTMSAVVDI